MNAHNDNTAHTGLRGWWLTPPRSGMRRLIAPWEYRNLRAFAGMRMAGGTAALILGAIVISQVSGAWVIYGAALLGVAVASYAHATWDLAIAQSQSAHA